MKWYDSHKRRIPHATVSLALAGALLALGLAGLPPRVEAHGGDPNLVHGCIVKLGKFVRLVGPSTACKKNETAVDWTGMGPSHGSLSCPPDAVPVGQTCVDKYEASVWQTSDPAVVAKIKAGTVTSADLAGATQISPSASCTPAFPGTFDATGNWTAPLYAVSIAGVPPTACASWFQAEQACALAGKRLLTNQEWQRAAAGTPDPGTDNGTTDCNVGKTFTVAPTGSRSLCVSKAGASDMVGNVWEWVADWTPQSTACPGWGGFADDFMCLSGASTVATGPGALIRGGDWFNGAIAGVFAVDGIIVPSNASTIIGFRCAR